MREDCRRVAAGLYGPTGTFAPTQEALAVINHMMHIFEITTVGVQRARDELRGPNPALATVVYAPTARLGEALTLHASDSMELFPRGAHRGPCAA
jgi:hypothetical protein